LNNIEASSSMVIEEKNIKKKMYEEMYVDDVSVEEENMI